MHKHLHEAPKRPPKRKPKGCQTELKARLEHIIAEVSESLIFIVFSIEFVDFCGPEDPLGGPDRLNIESRGSS